MTVSSSDACQSPPADQQMRERRLGFRRLRPPVPAPRVAACSALLVGALGNHVFEARLSILKKAVRRIIGGRLKPALGRGEISWSAPPSLPQPCCFHVRR